MCYFSCGIIIKNVNGVVIIPTNTGVQSAKVRAEQGLADAPVHIPLQIFVNLKTKTFSILEFHPSINSVCIIGYGDDFNLIGAKS